jgi:hypothetical protein
VKNNHLFCTGQPNISWSRPSHLDSQSYGCDDASHARANSLIDRNVSTGVRGSSCRH